MRPAAKWVLLAPAGAAVVAALVFLYAAVATAQGPGREAPPDTSGTMRPPAPATPAPGPAPGAPQPRAATAAAPAALPAVEVALEPLLPAAASTEKGREEPSEAGRGPRRPNVGDRVEAVLTLRAPAAGLRGEPRFPAWRERWGEAVRVIEAGEPERTGERDGVGTWRQRLVIAAFRPGKVPLPQVAVAVPLPAGTVEVRTPAGLALEIASVLPAGEGEPEPRPAAPPRPLPLGAPFWWTAAGLAAGCLAAGLLLWRRARAAAVAAAPAVILPPFEELMGSLAALDSEGSDLALHTRLSLALRRYLGRSLGFPAAESTTSELQRRLAAYHLPASLVRRTVELLRACDLVKFARQPAGEARSRERVEAARQIAAEVESILRPPEPVEAPAPLRKAG